MAVATAEGSARLLPRLQAAHEQWVLVYAVLFAAISNTLVNTGLGWAGSRHDSHIGLNGLSIAHPHLLSQAIGTAFFLPFFTTLITTYGVRKELAEGRIVRLEPPNTRWWRLLFPQHLLARSVRLGLASLVVIGPIAGVIVANAAPHGASRNAFLLVNTAAAVIFGAIATPIVAIAAMCDDTPLRANPALAVG